MELEGKFIASLDYDAGVENITSGHCDYRLGLHWHSSCSFTRYRLYVRHGFLQTRLRLRLRQHHCQQKSLGIWIFQIHYAVGYQERLVAANHDEHVSDVFVVFLGNYLLVLWKEVQDLDEK